MIFRVPSGLRDFELIGTIQILQALVRAGEPVAVQTEHMTEGEWLALAGLHYTAVEFHDVLHYDAAYRQLERSDVWYGALLAKVSGFSGLMLEPPRFTFGDTATTIESYDTLCYHSSHRELEIPLPVWQTTVKFLRTYGELVQVAPDGQRLEAAGFPESQVYSHATVSQKLERLAVSRLTVGLPNMFTWAAVGFGRPLIVLIPDDVPQQRWFPFLADKQPYRLLVYPRQKLEPAAVIAGLRHLIEGL